MRVKVSAKMRWGGYKNYDKVFEDEVHFDNWWGLMVKQGHKIIGYDTVDEDTA